MSSDTSVQSISHSADHLACASPSMFLDLLSLHCDVLKYGQKQQQI